MASSTSFPIEFGWVLPPGYNTSKDYFSPNRRSQWERGAQWMAAGPQGCEPRERWDAGVGRARGRW